MFISNLFKSLLEIMAECLKQMNTNSLFIVLFTCCVMNVYSTISNVTLDDLKSFNTVKPTLAVYVNRDGEIIKLDEFINSKVEDNEVDNPALTSSCRNYAMQVEKENIEGLDIEQSAKDVSSHLGKICNVELGVTKLQLIYDTLPYKNVHVNYKEKIEMIAGRIKKKIGNYLESLEKMKRYVEELYIQHIWSHPILGFRSCEKIQEKFLTYNKGFGTAVNLSESCEISDSKDSIKLGFSPGKNLTKLFKANLKKNPYLKWQYFITAKGVHSEFPAYKVPSYEPTRQSVLLNYLRHISVYTSTIYPQPKLVILLIDQSNSMSAKQFELAKNFSIGIIQSLSPTDYIGLISVDSVIHFPVSNFHSCKSSTANPAVGNLKSRMIACIENLNKATLGFGANHSAGLLGAFNMISKSKEKYSLNLLEDIQPLIIYVSRGLLWNANRGKAVLKLLLAESKKLQNSVIINTCSVDDGVRPLNNEKKFLKMVAQLYEPNLAVSPPKNLKQGKLVEFSEHSDLRASVNAIWQSLKETSNPALSFSLPIRDSIGNGNVISITKPCSHMRKITGMVGIDMHVNDFAEDIMYFNIEPPVKSYSFIVHQSGYVVTHSSYRNSKDSTTVSSIDIADIQSDVENFHLIREKLLNDYVGQKKLKLKKVSRNLQSNETSESEFTHAFYTWRKIEGTPFTVCIVVYDKSKVSKKFRTVNIERPSCSDNVRLHRLDTTSVWKHIDGLCKHSQQLMSPKTSTLFISPSSFISPYKYLNQVDTKEKLNSYLGYLCDTTNLIPNPGLKEYVRKDVAAVIRISDYWHEQVRMSNLNDYIIRRYVGVSSGVLLSFPGFVMNKDYDITQQGWFLKALENKGKIVITPSYSEGFGKSEQILTISHTIYEGKHASLHSFSDGIVAVMGMDVTIGYVHQLLVSTVPLCKEKNVRCFIFDNEGYLITHPNLVKPGGPYKKFDHITHGEQLIANDILCHEGFVEKKACNDFVTSSIQRSYIFNSNWNGVLTNLVHGEHCARYQITVIPRSNLFLGVINQTCEVEIAFCSCSTTDRLCLNCNRMDQTECECPCQCPIPLKELDRKSSGDASICRKLSKEPMIARLNESFIKEIDTCDSISCMARKTYHDCFSVIGCVWCERHYDGTHLKHPFCSSQTKCYQGVLMNQAAYVDDQYDTDNVKKSSPLPVPAAPFVVIGPFLLLVLMVYCTRRYRQRNALNSEVNVSTYVLPQNDSSFKMLPLDNELDDCFDDPVQSLNPQSMLLSEFPNFSPYRMSSTYRRPGTESSDHGYSTMTPRDESVHHGLSSTEPMSATFSDTAQSVTSFGSEISDEPLKPMPFNQTVIPDSLELKDGNRFIAHAQVHMVEA